MSKFEKQIGFGLQLAMAAAPNAGNVSEDQLKAVLEGMKDENTIAQAFDAAKDAVTDVVFAGDPGDDQKVMIVIKCNPVVSPEMVKNFAGTLSQIPDGQQIVVAVRLDYLNWENTSGLPGLIVAKADRRSALGGNIQVQEQ